MAFRLSLGRCNDVNVQSLANRLKNGAIEAGQKIIVGDKEYLVSPQLIVTRSMKDDLGEIYKFYREGMNGVWFLKGRQVINERGSYFRSVNIKGDDVIDSVSLGGQDSFVRQVDGSYIQAGLGNVKPVKASVADIEAAIDYIKGQGSVSNYTKLLRK
jgi:hypothetical protein